VEAISICLATTIVVAVFQMRAQNLPAGNPAPSFEVTTIKPSHGPGETRLRGPGGPNMAQGNFNTRTFIALAYNLPFNPDRVLGGPDWLDTKWYVIDGKISDELFAAMQKMTPEQSKNQTRLMWQALLADRFKLKVHFETRVMPIYELVVAKGGPKLTPAKEPPPAGTIGSSESGNPLSPGEMRQGIRVIRKTPASTEMTVKGETMDAWVLSPLPGLGHPLVNKTGLKGKYDFTLNWVQDDLSASPASGGLAAPSESSGPSLFTAIQEQLGLKLVPTKGPIEVILVDHIEQTSEN
jgi:bla regulator protein BlaR1